MNDIGSLVKKNTRHFREHLEGVNMYLYMHSDLVSFLREVIQIFVKSFDEPVCMENRGKWVDASMAERAAVSVLDLERVEVSEIQVDAKMGESARDMSHEEGSRFSYPVLEPPYEVYRTAVDHADPAACALAFAAAFLAAW
jgi:hypothetical protein